MKKLITVLVLLISLGISFNAKAQLTGIKTIPGNYATIAAAIADLNSNGVGSGGVTFNVAAGHTETSSNVTISILANVPTAANQVIFQKSGGGANPLITAAAGTSATLDGIIKFSGSDYITFDGIDLVDPATNSGNAAMEWGYALMRASTTDGTTNVTIKNCTITLQKINASSVGIYVINKDTLGTTIIAVDSLAQNNDNKFFGNNISNVYHGINAIAASTGRDLNNQIGVNGQTANSITNWGGSTLTCEGVRCEGQANVKVNNNIINGGSGTGGGAAVIGIIISTLTTATARNYEISYNQITVSSGAVSQPVHGIRALGTGDTISVHHNTVENCTAFLNTSAFGGIAVDQVGTSNVVLIHDNIVRNNSSSGTGSSTLIAGGGSSGFINNLVIRDNQIYGNQKTGISGTMSCIAVTDALVNCYSNTIYNNSMPNTSGTTASAIYGYLNSGNPMTTENIYNNNIYKLTIGGNNTSASSVVAGIRANSGASTVKDIYGNTIDSLSTVSGRIISGGAIGIWSTAGLNVKIRENKIYNLSNTSTLGSSAGCWVTSGTSILVYNNFISNLKTPNSNDTNAVIGINCTSTAANSNVGIYYNSIHLNAAGGTTFGSSGISVTASATATTASLKLNNNIVVNLSTPGSSSGKVVAFRRNNTNFQNFENSSNYNNFYAGIPAANRLVFSNGGGSDQTIAAYQTRVAPRDVNAKSVTVNFVDPSIGDLHLTGASIQDVNLIAKPISGITTDIDGNTRNANHPYKGADESTAFPLMTLNLTINFQACAETDTITVELRSSTAPYDLIESAVALGGQGIPQVVNFAKASNGVNYYIVVKHRNSIETWSKAGGEVFTAGSLTYDYTTSATQAFGSNMILVGSDYSFYSGDVQQDGTVDVSDVVLIYNDATNFVSGYVVTDLNCDDFVDVTDISFAYNNSTQFVSVIRP